MMDLREQKITPNIQLQAQTNNECLAPRARNMGSTMVDKYMTERW